MTEMTDPTIPARVEALLAELSGYRTHTSDQLVVFRDDVRGMATRLVTDLVAAEQARDKWVDNFNRSEQFQNGPTKRADAAEQERDPFKETATVLEAHARLLLSDNCTSEDRTRIRREMGLIPEGEADRPDWQAKREWQPIETMPERGPFLVYWSKNINGVSGIDMVGGLAEYSEIIEFGEPPATHWMPLPDAPALAPHGVIVRRETK